MSPLRLIMLWEKPPNNSGSYRLCCKKTLHRRTKISSNMARISTSVICRNSGLRVTGKSSSIPAWCQLGHLGLSMYQKREWLTRYKETIMWWRSLTDRLSTRTISGLKMLFHPDYKWAPRKWWSVIMTLVRPAIGSKPWAPLCSINKPSYSRASPILLRNSPPVRTFSIKEPALSSRQAVLLERHRWRKIKKLTKPSSRP